MAKTIEVMVGYVDGEVRRMLFPVRGAFMAHLGERWMWLQYRCPVTGRLTRVFNRAYEGRLVQMSSQAHVSVN